MEKRIPMEKIFDRLKTTAPLENRRILMEQKVRFSLITITSHQDLPQYQPKFLTRFFNTPVFLL